MDHQSGTAGSIFYAIFVSENANKI